LKREKWKRKWGKMGENGGKWLSVIERASVKNGE
jgi:hypothetical protein